MQLLLNQASAVRMNLPSLSASLVHHPSLVRTALPVLLASATSSSLSMSENDSNNDQPVPEPSAWDPTAAVSSTSTTPVSRMDQVKQLFTEPRPRAILYMATAMAFHFGGYEFVRSGMLALFTSSEFGFSSQGAFPLAMGMTSPFTFILLLGYGTVLEKRGPRAALKATTLFSLLVFAVTAVLLQLLQTTTAVGPHIQWISRAVVALAFVYQNSYAHLLYSQEWSFLSSVMTPDEGSVWFAAIAGMSSALCTLTGAIVKPLVNKIGLIGIVGCNCLFLLLSLICSDRAYQLSEIHGFDPAKIKKQQKEKQENANAANAADPGSNKSVDESQPKNLLLKAKDLFLRVPTLGALFGEVITFQSMSVIFNIAMVARLKQVMPNDNDRAAWTGQLFASISGVSGLLQFIVIPLFLKRIEPRLVWKVMPLVPLVFSLYQSFQGAAPSLSVLAMSFFSAKMMDYSIRGVVNEMVYQPLDFDSRYLGKEIIGVFGSRFGKSGVSLLLSGLAYVFPNFGIYHLSKLSVVASAGWLSMSWWLSGLVGTKAEAQEAFLEQRRPDQQQPESSNKTDAPAKAKEE